MEQMQIVILT